MLFIALWNSWKYELINFMEWLFDVQVDLLPKITVVYRNHAESVNHKVFKTNPDA